MRYVSPVLSVVLVAGLAAGVSVEIPVRLFVTLTMAAAWAWAMLAFQCRKGRQQMAAGLLLVAGGGWILGAGARDRALHTPLREVLERRLGGFAVHAAERRSEEPVTIEGRLLGDAQVSDDGIVLRVGVTRVWIHGAAEATSGGVSLGVSGELHGERAADWRRGRLIRAPALLRRPARYLNRGLPDQERAQARRGVSLVGTIKSAALVEVVARGHWWEELAAALRARTRAALRRHVAAAGVDAASIATAILIGDRSGLSIETERRLQEAGTYHVIAISGGNIAILAGLLLGSLALAGCKGRVALIAAIVVLTAYATVAAGGPSVLRATLMAVVYLAVRLIDQRTAAANAISLSAAAILVVQPVAVADVGLWLTFGATVALVAAAEQLRSGRENGQGRGSRLRRLVRLAAFVLIGTLCVEIALTPIAAYVFQRVTFAGLILNFAALPAMTVVQLGAMAVVIADLAGLETLAGWIGQAVQLGGTVLVRSADVLDLAPWLTWRVPSPHPFLVALYYSAIGLMVMVSGPILAQPTQQVRACGRARIRRVAKVAVIGLFLWFITAPPARIRALGDGRLHLSMLDVGQGDALLVTFPNGRRLLVDTGGTPRGTFDVGDRVVGPVLRALNILSLDYVVVTHADSDHVGGVGSILRDFGPLEVWWGIPVAGHAATAAVWQDALRARAAWRTLQQGDRIHVGGVDVVLHHPPRQDWERQRIRNNDSLVIELRFGRVSMLLTGDIGHDVETLLLPALDLLPAVVLKVAHHGSATSSSSRFLDTIRPRIALIGVGRGNAYGHPSPYVLGRLHDAGAAVFRTDLDGQVDVVTDGVGISVRTWTGKELTP